MSVPSSPVATLNDFKCNSAIHNLKGVPGGRHECNVTARVRKCNVLAQPYVEHKGADRDGIHCSGTSRSWDIASKGWRIPEKIYGDSDITDSCMRHAACHEKFHIFLQLFSFRIEWQIFLQSALVCIFYAKAACRMQIWGPLKSRKNYLRIGEWTVRTYNS